MRLLGWLPTTGRLLASWQLSVVLMILAALYYVLLAVFAALSPPGVVRNIAGLLPFWVVYALLLLNTCFCLWRRLSALRRDLSASPLSDQREPRWERPTLPALTQDRARSGLRRAGYRVSTAGDGALVGARGRWANLGPFVFHGALLVIAAGFLLTLGYRSETKLWVAEGEAFTGARGQLKSGPAPGDLRFQVHRIRPEFWRDQLLFTKLEAEVEVLGEERSTTRINRPLWLAWDRYFRISGFGYTPRYELLGRSGALESAFVKMNVFPPGQRDWFRPGRYPYRVHLTVFPDGELKHGVPRTRSLNLVSPLLQIQVTRGKVELGSGLLRRGQGHAFEGLKLRFPEIRYWGEFTLVRDPGALPLFIGFALLLVGLALRLRGGRAEVRWTPGGDDRGTLRGWGDASPPAGLLEAGERS